MRKCRIGTAKFFTLLLLLYRTSVKNQGLSLVPVSVNLSVHHTNNRRAPGGLDKIIRKYDVDSEYITFELTENIYMKEFENAMYMGTELNKLGYSRSIDDFGSGFSGINLWRYLDFEELKLDMSFLSEEPELDGKNNILIKGIAKTTEMLGIRLIAEGVEKPDQCRKLIESGCCYGQGYYFSRPVPADIFYEMYDRQNGTFII